MQRSDARQILIDYWMGHSSASMGDRYGRQLVEDIEYRQDQVKKVVLGFELPPALFGPHGLQIVTEVIAAILFTVAMGQTSASREPFELKGDRLGETVPMLSKTRAEANAISATVIPEAVDLESQPQFMLNR
jgi:hypothetical protein